VKPEPEWDAAGLTHDQLVRGVRAYVDDMQKLEAGLALERRTPEEIIHDKLSWQGQFTASSDPELVERRKDFFFGLNLGWKALAHERFNLFSTAASVSAYALSGYAHQYGRRTIEITPEQRNALAACAEVVGIPFDPEATEISIPESALYRNERLLEAALGTKGNYLDKDRGGKLFPSQKPPEKK